MSIDDKCKHLSIRFDHRTREGTPLYRCESPDNKVPSCGALEVPFVYQGKLDLENYHPYKIKPYLLYDAHENKNPMRQLGI